MYSPFSDSKGRPLTIEKVKFSHLSQLVDCDKGHHVEYKLLHEDGGKAQLAKEITSFANCEGGWLIVGIDDKTKGIIYHEEGERAKLYYTNLEKEAAVLQEKESFLNKVFKGNAGLMISTMVEQNELSDQEIEQLIELLQSKK